MDNFQLDYVEGCVHVWNLNLNTLVW